MKYKTISASAEHIIEPELLVATPRPVRYTAVTQFVRAMAFGVWITVTAMMVIGVYQTTTRLRELAESGKTINATVVERDRQSPNSSWYDIKYRYTLEAIPYTDRETVQKDDYDSKPLGAPIPITYLPGKPWIHREGSIDNAMVGADTQDWVLAILAVFVIGGCIVFYWESEYKKRLRLMQQGIAVTGRVLGMETTNAGKSKVRTVAYSYSNGAYPMQARASVSSRFYRSIEPGDTITVLHMPRDPADSLPYREISEVKIV